MSTDDPTPREMLGDDLWDALGAVRPPPPLPASLGDEFQRRSSARSAPDEAPPADTPHAVLGEALWDALGAVPSPPALPAGLSGDFRRPEADARTVLGDDLWDALGAAPAPAPPAADLAAVRAAAGSPPALRRWPIAAAALAAAAAFLGVVWGWPAPDAADDLALVQDLAFAENLELLENPDFELLVRWDGAPP